MRTVMPLAGAFKHAPKLQYVPILIGDDGNYPTEANRYLDERCNGEWRLPGQRVGAAKIPTLKSRKDIAARLACFLEWARKQENDDWHVYNYQEHILEGYQADLIRGKGSPSARNLSPASANLYAGEACLFLCWAAERGYRARFDVPRRSVTYRIRSATSSSDVTAYSEQRAGLLSTNEVPISVPSNEEVERWIMAAKVRAPIKSLIFELITRCGLRISEANLMRVTCFPKKTYEELEAWDPNWIALGEVPMTIKYGTKGGKVTPASDLGTRWRTIEIPLDLADRIWHYITLIRPTLLSRYRQRVGVRGAVTDRLWIGEGKLLPVTNEMLRRVWKSTPHCPPGWHPHCGRHFFAVEKLSELTRTHLNLKGLAVKSDSDFGWLHGLLAGQIQMILSPLMGHVSPQTTMQYLRAAVAKMARDKGHPSIRWNALVDEF